ncbi:MAG: SIS domain-containing protein [Pelolinea sp.]|nr:SIS domain-containing protein [Pelolinea sp.]
MELTEKGIYTRNEILSQPESWKATLIQLKQDWNGKLPDVKKYDHVIFTGCGSTYYLSIWASRLLQKELGISSQALPASELWYALQEWTAPFKRILLVAISRSGETTETLHAVDEFQKNKCGDVLAVTCYPESKLAKKPIITLSIPAGQEESVAQTRSFSNMMLAVLSLINGGIPEELPQKIFESAKSLIDTYANTVQTIGKDFRNTNFFFLGNGPLIGLANEAMLKMKEMSLSYSEAFHFMEFRHGPMSMVNSQSLVIGLTSSLIDEYELPVLKDMKDLGAEILAIGSKKVLKVNGYGHAIELPDDIPQFWQYPFYLPLLQLMAYERSLSKGLNPDKPENLTAVVEL